MVMGSGSLSTISSLLTLIRTTSPASSDPENHGIEEDLNQLERMLRKIRATLRDAGEREIRDESVKLWLTELRDIAFDAEDVLDEYRYEIRRRQAEEREKKPDDFGWIDLDAITKKIRKIKMQFEDISRDREALRLREEDGERYNISGDGRLSLTSHMFDESAIFGRSVDKEKILDLVLSNDAGDEPMVIPIIGMGGIGKTTMAQMVYSDPRVKENFDIRVWVHVSTNFDVMKITMDILKSVGSNNCSTLEGLSVSQDELKELVEGKRFFMVLDDVWNEQCSHWELLLQPLRAAKIMKFIVTARNRHVTEIMQATDVYFLGRLPKHQSWSLFQHYAFGGPTVESSRLVQIGKEIVTKCCGLPLAIKTIGGLLRYKSDEYYWREILQSELWECDGKDEIFPALKVSYYSLPSELKPCFLYCSLFPRGSLFEKDQLIHMWMAQGYIIPMGAIMPEDIGNRYFSELYMRSFVESGSVPDSFRLHDLMHDLARATSTGDFFAIHDGNFCNIPSETRHVHIKGTSETHHAHVIRRTLNCRFSKPGLLRTLNWEVTNQISQHSFQNTYLNIHECIRLRVLAFPYYNVTSLEFLPRLKHLRYLSIIHCNLERLPKSICLLFNLEILKLIDFHRLKELPIDIGKLSNLRYFHIFAASIRELPESMFELKKLQNLIVEFCPIEEVPACIGNLVGLKSLAFRYNQIRSVPRTICHLSELQVLDLRGNLSFEDLLCDIGEYLDQHSLDIWTSLHSSPFFPRKPELWQPAFPGLANIMGRFSITTYKRGSNNIAENNIADLANTIGILFMPSREQSSENVRNYFLRMISQNRVDDYVLWRIREAWCLKKYGIINIKYRKTNGLLESLEPAHNLIELSINGCKGVAYPKWRNSPVVMKDSMFVLMKWYIEDGTFLSLLSQLRSLKSLCLRGISSIIVLANALMQKHYGQSVTPECTKKPFPSLQELKFKDMLEWEQWGVVDDGFPKLKVLTLKNCPRLRSLPIDYPSLVRLEVRRCGITELKLDQINLEDIHIEDCCQLTTLLGLQNLSSKATLYIARCPLLVFSLNQTLLLDSIYLEIVDCTGLKKWCQSQSYSHVYKQVSSCKSLVNSDVQKLMKYGPQNFCSLAHLHIQDAKLSNKMFGSMMNLFPPTLISLDLISIDLSDTLSICPNFCKLRRLEIRDCLKLKLLEGLHELSSLSCLVLWNCPLLILRSEIMSEEAYPEVQEKVYPEVLEEEEFPVQNLSHEEDQEIRRKKEGKLPPLLESLVIHGCHSMLSLHMILDYPSLMIEFQIRNCSRLVYIEGLRDLVNLETMIFINCPQLLLDLLDYVPECMVISGCPRLKYWCDLHAIKSIDDQLQDPDDRHAVTTADLLAKLGVED